MAKRGDRYPTDVEILSSPSKFGQIILQI